MKNTFQGKEWSDHAVAVLLITPEGTPVIRDPKKPKPVFWKLPGGRSEAGETAENCAIREMQEETGIVLAESDLTVIHKEDRDTHTLTIFKANKETMPDLKTKGNEGEEIKIFTPEEILTMQDFFPPHQKIIKETLENLQ